MGYRAPCPDRPSRDAEIFRLRGEGLSMREIGDAGGGYSKSTVLRVLNESRTPLTTPAYEARDGEILRLHSKGMSLRQIAVLVGWSTNTVHEVVNPEAHARYKARRRARNTSPEGLRRHREYRARRAR